MPPPPSRPFAFPQFNKSVSVEAGLSFPKNVTCSTINAISLKGDLSNYKRGDGGHLTCTAKELQSAITAKGCEDVRPFFFASCPHGSKASALRSPPSASLFTMQL